MSGCDKHVRDALHLRPVLKHARFVEDRGELLLLLFLLIEVNPIVAVKFNESWSNLFCFVTIRGNWPAPFRAIWGVCGQLTILTAFSLGSLARWVKDAYWGRTLLLLLALRDRWGLRAARFDLLVCRLLGRQSNRDWSKIEVGSFRHAFATSDYVGCRCFTVMLEWVVLLQ